MVSPAETMTTSELPEFGSLLPRQDKKKIVWFWPVAAIIIVVFLTYGVLNYFPGAERYNGFQAVFLTNGQVYFGIIAKENSRYVYMTDVYYIQVQEQIQPSTVEGEAPVTISVPTLLKRGQELHGPDGSLKLNRDQVIAIENVGEESQVWQQILGMRAGN